MTTVLTLPSSSRPMNTPKSSSPTPQSTSEMRVDKLLGSGKFKVYHAYLPFEQEEYALKAYPKEKSAQVSYTREKEIMSHLSHKNIIKYIPSVNGKSLITNPNWDYMLLEYAPYGSFYELVLSKGLTDEKLMRTYFRQLIEGLEYLHMQGVAHLDLKLDNLLLAEDFVLKITDFDQSQRTDERELRCKGTTCYRAPEILEGRCTNMLAADIYSVGVILYTTKAREFPFVEHSDGARTNLIHYDLFTEENEEFWRTKVADKKNNDFFSQNFKDLMNGMLEKDPSKRFTLQDIKNSRWYNEPIFKSDELKVKMERMWERILFKKSLKRAHSPNNN